MDVIYHKAEVFKTFFEKFKKQLLKFECFARYEIHSTPHVKDAITKNLTIYHKIFIKLYINLFYFNISRIPYLFYFYDKYLSVM